MARYYLTNKAVDDITDIWNFTFETWSEKQADLYYQMLIESFEEITHNPEIGKNYQEIRTDLLGLRVNKHIVFYRVLSGELIEITKILHERMDLKNRV